MGTKMLKGPSLKTKKFKPTQNLLPITDHDFDSFAGKGCYLDNFSSESGKIMICGR